MYGVLPEIIYVRPLDLSSADLRPAMNCRIKTINTLDPELPVPIGVFLRTMVHTSTANRARE